MKKLFTSLLLTGLLLGATSAVSAAEPAPLRWAGTFSIWQRPACPPTTDCPTPQALTPPVPIELLLQLNFQEGRHVVGKRTWQSRDWRVEMLVVQVSAGLFEPSYLVTQVRLDHRKRGMIAECSRYHSIESFTSFPPPGACSGRDGTAMSGVSFAK